MPERTNVAQGGSGVTLVVMKDDKVAEIMEKAKPLVESIQRHQLELIRAGLQAAQKEDNGCCNCVLC